jgi:predicted Rossmann fold nucleotide-binding protein DprA/Smf involved in DNA uptake
METASATTLIAAADALARALRDGRPPPDDVPETIAWAALDAAGIGGGYRAAVVAAGGPRAVLASGALTAFASPRRRRQLLDGGAVAARLALLPPWLGVGFGIVADDIRLRRFVDHPACAFYSAGADVPDAGRPVIGIVGSREAGPALLARTGRLAARLAGAGAVVVSGGAVGVDQAAQQAARRAGGDVVVISGQSLSGRVGLPHDVVADPGLCWLTPYAPWSPGRPHGRFAQRNAFIAAMADVVVAVAGGPKSGTRHTIEAGLLFGRPVVGLAPCAAQPELASLAERLTESEAGVVVDDDTDLAGLLALRPVADGHTRWQHHGQLRLPLPPSSPSSSCSANAVPPALAASATCFHPATVDHALVRLLQARGPLSIDDAAAALAVSVRELLVDVAELELDGALRREGAVLAPARV